MTAQPHFGRDERISGPAPIGQPGTFRFLVITEVELAKHVALCTGP